MCIAYILGKEGGGKIVEWGATMGGGGLCPSYIVKKCPDIYEIVYSEH
jgi:hypothetical protein